MQHRPWKRAGRVFNDHHSSPPANLSRDDSVGSVVLARSAPAVPSLPTDASRLGRGHEEAGWKTRPPFC